MIPIRERIRTGQPKYNLNLRVCISDRVREFNHTEEMTMLPQQNVFVYKRESLWGQVHLLRELYELLPQQNRRCNKSNGHYNNFCLLRKRFVKATAIRVQRGANKKPIFNLSTSGACLGFRRQLLHRCEKVSGIRLGNSRAELLQRKVHGTQLPQFVRTQ